MAVHHPFSLLLKNCTYPEDFLLLDLSVDNSNLNNKTLTDPTLMEKWIEIQLSLIENKKIAYGGYLEKRNLYQQNLFTQQSENALEQRNIHLGIDFWTKAATPVFAPIGGVVHSVQNNKKSGDYGPTVILYHQQKDRQFFSLYGHLSEGSLDILQPGAVVKKGQKIAYLGDPTINGGYAPHLHFQIIKNMQHYIGDYPGVCSQSNLSFFTNNCPDPEIYLRPF